MRPTANQTDAKTRPIVVRLQHDAARCSLSLVLLLGRSALLCLRGAGLHVNPDDPEARECLEGLGGAAQQS